MSNNNLGRICLVVQIVFSIVPWTAVEILPDPFDSALLILASVLSILMWYEAIKISMEKSIKDGLKVSLFFLIPCALLTIMVFPTFFRDKLIDGFIYIPWFFFTMPFRIAPLEDIPQRTSNSYVYFDGLEPIAIFVLIIIVNLILVKAKGLIRKQL
jgi:hypothetical protein